MFDLLFTKGDGFYSLSTAGNIAFVLLLLILVGATAFFVPKKENTKKLTTKQLVFCSAALALGFITSYLKLFELPWGGAVTLLSMLFICLIGYWYGLKVGLMTGLAYGILQFIQGGSFILSPMQVCLDYLFAFTALGFSGLFSNSKGGLIKGYILGIFLRGVFNSLAGYLYWRDYMPDNFPKALVSIYPIAYNYSYIAAEGVITVIILLVPAVAAAMKQVKLLATDEAAASSAAQRV